MKVFIETLGCPKNFNDSETVAGLLEKAGHEIAAIPSEADAIIVNTCGFINDAKKESIERIFDTIDYIYRVLTGTCGRRALSKIGKRIRNIMLHTLPRRYLLSGTVGLCDPCLNGRMTGACAMLMPVCDDSLQIETQWEEYRCDLRAEAEGKMYVGVPVKEALPLVFDRDCRKLYKKLLRARYKLVKNTATDNH